MNFSVDYIFITIYFIIILYVSFKFGRNKDREDFLIAKRQLNYFDIGMSIFSSKVGAGILLTYSALVYNYGVDALWYFIGTIIGYLLFYFFALKIKTISDKNKYYNLSDLFFHKKGTMTG
jgi:Na+/proline symporter